MGKFGGMLMHLFLAATLISVAFSADQKCGGQAGKPVWPSPSIIPEPPKAMATTDAMMGTPQLLKSSDTLRGENFLFSVARIALTFVGFASLVSLLRHGQPKWTQAEIRGLKLMFKFDLAATFFALFPIPLSYTIGVSYEKTIWRIASGLMAIYLIYALTSETRLYRLTDSPRRRDLFRWLFVVPMFPAIVLQIVTGLFWPSVALAS